MCIFMTGLKKGVQMLISVHTVYELVLYSEFLTFTIASNKGFMRLFAKAPYLMIEKSCSAAYLTSDLNS